MSKQVSEYPSCKSLINRSKRFVKIFKNMQSRSIKVRKKIWEITKSAVFPSFFFSFNLAIFHYFVKRGFPQNIAWNDGSFDAHILRSVFFITKGHLRWSILILAKNVFFNVTQNQKVHQFYYLKLIPLKFVKIFHPQYATCTTVLMYVPVQLY